MRRLLTDHNTKLPNRATSMLGYASWVCVLWLHCLYISTLQKLFKLICDHMKLSFIFALFVHYSRASFIKCILSIATNN